MSKVYQRYTELAYVEVWTRYAPGLGFYFTLAEKYFYEFTFLAWRYDVKIMIPKRKN